MEHYIKTTEEIEGTPVERVFAADELALDFWMVRMSHELRENMGPILYGVGVGGSIVSEPVIHKERVYFGCCDRNVYAVDLDGNEVWRFRTGGANFYIRLYNNRLYFGSFDGNFYAVDLGGNLIWNYSCGDSIGGIPLIHNRTIYFGSKDRNFYALTLDGKLEWKFATTSPLLTRAIAYKRNVFFSGCAGGKYYCLDTEGNCKWTFETGYLCSSGKIHNEILYITSLNKYLYALNLDGKQVWKALLPAEPTNVDPIVNNDHIYVNDYEGNLSCFDVNGKLLWKFPTKDILYARPIFYEGKLYIGSTDMNFYCLDEESGTLIWKFPSSGPITTAAALQGNRIVYGGYDCNLYCISTEGSLMWKFPTSLSYVSPVTVSPQSQERHTIEVTVPAEEAVTTEEKYKSKTEEHVFGGSVYSGLELGYTGGSIYTDKKKRRYR